MSDPAFKPHVDEIRRFLYEAQGGKLSDGDEEFLRMRGNMEEILKNLQETGEFDHIATLKELCRVVLYGDYICTRNCAAVFSKKVAEFKEANSRSMPAVFRPKIKEIGVYFEKLKEHINKLDSLAKHLNEMLNDFFQREDKITEQENMKIEFLGIDFKAESQTAKEYYEQADRVLKLLESDVKSYKKENKIPMIYAGLALLATVSTIATGGVAAAPIAGVFGGVVGGGSYLLGNYFYSTTCEQLEVKCEDLNSELRILGMDEKEKSGTVVREIKKLNRVQIKD